MIVVSFGGGTNSTAMLVEMVKRGEPCDAIVFADTGGEKPATYTYRDTLSAWLVERGYPAIETIRRKPAIVKDGFATTLEDECLMRGQLPGIAYGFKSCSDKWKIQPFNAWLAGRDATVCVGFDAGEPHRAAKGDEYDSGYTKRYPLIEWNWGREECVAAIADAGLEQPGKSSCFFCPNSKPSEIIALSKVSPELFARAVAMEDNADLTTIKGLGRNFSWKALVQFDNAQLKMFDGAPDMPCGCCDEAA